MRRTTFRGAKRATLLASTLALTVLAATACASTPGDSSSEGSIGKITLASSITGSSFLAVTAGMDQEIFEKHGLEIELVKVKSSAEAAAAVASGQADLAAMLPEGVIAVASAGSKMRMIGNLLNQVQYRLVTTSEVTSASDLIGKKVGIVGPGSGEEVLARAYLDSQGVDPSQVTFVATGTMAAKYAAMTTNQLEGAMLVPPFDIKAEAAGMRPLSVLGEDFPDMPAQVFASSDKALSSNGDTVKKFMAAAAESAQWVVAHPEDATKILSEDSQVSMEDAKLSFDRAKSAYSQDSAISREGLNRWLALSKKYSSLANVPTIDELYDAQYLAGTAARQ
ncbi:ABC transporter substrate-binding protein [Pseudarthrobacter sp. NPDC058329]|uniref:ABC transporter substrate-binding protein n=1 Tax=Pseudarthrobacter sp. NPDC058329 TaxID=3346448 RepID=UPI0036DD51E6